MQFLITLFKDIFIYYVTTFSALLTFFFFILFITHLFSFSTLSHAYQACDTLLKKDDFKKILTQNSGF